MVRDRERVDDVLTPTHGLRGVGLRDREVGARRRPREAEIGGVIERTARQVLDRVWVRGTHGHARWKGARVEHDDIVRGSRGGQPGEEVEAGGVGHGRFEEGAVSLAPVPVRVAEQPERDAPDPVLVRVTGVPDPVAVRVVVDRVADRAERAEPEVDGMVVGVRGEDHQLGSRRRRPVPRRDRDVVGKDHREVPVAGEVREEVRARRVRHLQVDEEVAVVEVAVLVRVLEEVDDRAFDPQFARIHDAVPVLVPPDGVADGRGPPEPEVGGEIRLARDNDRGVRLVRGRQRVTVRRGDRDRVDAGREPGEVIGPVRPGDGPVGRAGAVAEVDVRRRREGHGHALEPGLAGVLDTVAVDVEPDEVAHDREGAVPEVDRVPALPRLQGEGQRVRRRVREVEGGGRGLVHDDDVLPAGEARETVTPGRVRQGRGEEALSRVGDSVRVIVAVDEKPDAGDPGLARVVDTVAVEVFPDQVAAGRGARIPEVDVRRRLPHGERAGVGAVEGAVGVAGLREPGRERRGVDRDRVGARRQVREGVVAVGVRGRGVRPAGRGQHELHVRDPILSRVLDPVSVGIEPDPVADRPEGREPDVDREVDLAGRQCDRDRVRRGRRGAGGKVGIGVVGEDHVAPGPEAREEVAPGRVRRRCVDDPVSAVDDAVSVRVEVQTDRDVRDARLAGVLDPVSVRVREDRVPDRAAVIVPEVCGEVALAARERDRVPAVLRRVGVTAQGVPGREGGGDDPDRIRAGRKAREEVVAVGVGRVLDRDTGAGAQVDPRRRGEFDSRVRNPRLAGVQDAVPVRVCPDDVPDRAADEGRDRVRLRAGGEERGLVEGRGVVDRVRRARRVDRHAVAQHGRDDHAVRHRRRPGGARAARRRVEPDLSGEGAGGHGAGPGEGRRAAGRDRLGRGRGRSHGGRDAVRGADRKRSGRDPRHIGRPRVRQGHGEVDRVAAHQQGVPGGEAARPGRASGRDMVVDQERGGAIGGICAVNPPIARVRACRDQHDPVVADAAVPRRDQGCDRDGPRARRLEVDAAVARRVVVTRAEGAGRPVARPGAVGVVPGDAGLGPWRGHPVDVVDMAGPGSLERYCEGRGVDHGTRGKGRQGELDQWVF